VLRVLATYPIFEGVSESALSRLVGRVKERHYESGEVILHAGDRACELHVLVAGVVRVLVADRPGRRVLLAPPQTFGEMSTLSGDPVSATIVARSDVDTWAISREDLFETLADEPAFFRNLSSALIDRLRNRTREDAAALGSSLVLVVFDSDHPSATILFKVIDMGVGHYAPGSHAMDVRDSDTGAAVVHARQWRAESTAGEYLLIAVRPAQLGLLRSELKSGDLVVSITSDPRAVKGTPPYDVADADTATVLLGDRREGLSSDAPWCHVFDAASVARAQRTDLWSRASYPTVDRLVRQIVRREVGLAMSVGAAAGLAHFGLLEVLEEEGIPLDYVCGSSMGGAVALGFAQYGSATAACDAFCRLAADFARSKGLQWLPRAGLVSKARMESITAQLFGTKTFAELPISAAVVAADLVAGRRVVRDSGSVAVAASATAAIPGLFTPVRLGDAVLVDGGLVTRVPVDLMAVRRCGLKLASVIRPDSVHKPDELRFLADGMEASLDRPFGFRSALGASWKLLGWWDSAAQAQQADLVISIPVPAPDGYNFAAGKNLVERGRLSAQADLLSIRAAVKRLMSPGLP
jgi:predicted acylesterase/phospholipase RssA